MIGNSSIFEKLDIWKDWQTQNVLWNLLIFKIWKLAPRKHSTAKKNQGEKSYLHRRRSCRNRSIMFYWCRRGRQNQRVENEIFLPFMGVVNKGKKKTWIIGRYIITFQINAEGKYPFNNLAYLGIVQILDYVTVLSLIYGLTLWKSGIL